MDQLEQNIVNSFRLAKSDIIALKSEVIKSSENQKKIIQQLDQLGLRLVQLQNKSNKPRVVVHREISPPKIITKTVFKTAKKRFVASKKGKDFHIRNCPFARNIKPKAKLHFHSKNAALNKGFKPCKCIS